MKNLNQEDRYAWFCLICAFVFLVLSFQNQDFELYVCILTTWAVIWTACARVLDKIEELE